MKNVKCYEQTIVKDCYDKNHERWEVKLPYESKQHEAKLKHTYEYQVVMGTFEKTKLKKKKKNQMVTYNNTDCDGNSIDLSIKTRR